KEQEDRDAGLLHGRPDRVSHLRGGAGPRRRGRLVSRRRTRHRPAEQPALAGREEQGAVPDRDCLERRSALAERKERAQGDLRKSQIAGRDRSLLWGSRLVPAGFARLQRTGRRKGVEAAAGAVRQGAGLVLLLGTARTGNVPTAPSPSRSKPERLIQSKYFPLCPAKPTSPAMHSRFDCSSPADPQFFNSLNTCRNELHASQAECASLFFKHLHRFWHFFGTH